ncbi:MAG: hypothetical protein M3N26_00940 [Pseudomonadota bacterium]|nr:hypothetical protein [Pseudomonadota bacterium]
MPLLGSAVLTIWNGMAPGADADFAAWHVREHMPERLAVPGFLRGRRYAAIEAHPAYFNFYETLSAAVLTSPAYLARLNAPSPWTRRVVSQFRDTGRTVCDVVESRGQGEGGVIETIEFKAAPGASGAAPATNMLTAFLDAPGVVGAHLLQGRAADSTGGTREKSLRDQPDQVAEWVMLLEAIDADAIRTAREGACSDEVLTRAGAAPEIKRGLYALQFGLTATNGDGA